MKNPSDSLAVLVAPRPVRTHGVVSMWRGWLAKLRPVLRPQPLDVSVLSPHMQRDLNLHGAADGRLQAQHAWQAHERYRDSRSWRTPL